MDFDEDVDGRWVGLSWLGSHRFTTIVDCRLLFRPLDGFGAAGLGLVAYDDDDAMSPPTPSPPPPQPSAEPISDSRRQALREIEMKVVKYQDELEACRRRGDSTVTDEAISKVRVSRFSLPKLASMFFVLLFQQVDRFRERLLEKLEETQETPAKSKSSNSRTATASSKSLKTSASASSKRHHNSSSTSSRRHEDARSSHRRHSKSPSGDYAASPMSGKRSRDDLPELREEGEASDDEAGGGSSHSQPKRSRHRDDEVLY